MTTFINLHRPKGFSDSSKFALNPSTGELLEWKWESLDPEDFSLNQNGDVFHNCGDKKSWSRVVRHGENANNFFEEVEEKCEIASHRSKKVWGGDAPKFNTSYKGKIQLRKKKYKKRKYKNSKMRKQKWPDKRRKEKVFKKAVATREITKSAVPVIEKCQWCRTSSENDNIFNCPQERHCCDFCKKCFEGFRLNGKVCNYCLHLVYRSNFCDDCKKNLGEWNVNWRMKLKIPQEHHPPHCKCEQCFQYRWSRPCLFCGMIEHTSHNCPWGIYDDYEDDRIQEAVRDDYLFGWG